MVYNVYIFLIRTDLLLYFYYLNSRGTIYHNQVLIYEKYRFSEVISIQLISDNLILRFY